MNKLMEWLKRVLGAAFRGFISSWGNPVGGEIAAVGEIGKIAVEEIQHHEAGTQTSEASGETRETPVSDNSENDRPIPMGEAKVIPGPTTFDKPVDETYGRNRKH